LLEETEVARLRKSEVEEKASRLGYQLLLPGSVYRDDFGYRFRQGSSGQTGQFKNLQHAMDWLKGDEIVAQWERETKAQFPLRHQENVVRLLGSEPETEILQSFKQQIEEWMNQIATGSEPQYPSPLSRKQLDHLYRLSR